MKKLLIVFVMAISMTNFAYAETGREKCVRETMKEHFFSKKLLGIARQDLKLATSVLDDITNEVKLYSNRAIYFFRQHEKCTKTGYTRKCEVIANKGDVALKLASCKSVVMNYAFDVMLDAHKFEKERGKQ